MTNLADFTETPNLLELIEAYRNDFTAIGGLSICDDDITRRDLSVCGDDIGLPSSLMDLSPCADELRDQAPELSLCADEVEAPTGARLNTDIEQRGSTFSVCADEVTSDVRLKTDIEQVGTTVYGLPLYHFRYKSGTERFEGVMAQDVLEVMPDAVVVGEDGYCRVKYGQLGIRMTRA